jgi:leucyl aminopeptidase
MQTTIKLSSSYKAGDSIILLTDDKGTLPKGVFSTQETDFIKKELKNEKRSIFLNQYNRLVAIYQPDAVKDFNKTLEKCRKAGEVFLSGFKKQKTEKVIIVDQINQPQFALALAEGMALANYQFLKYLKNKKKDENSLKEIAIVSKELRQSDIHQLQNVVDAVYRARTLVNEPQSWLTATQLAAEFEKLGKEAGFSVKVLNKKKIKELKMGGLLAVNMGSKQPPTFTIMEWNPKNAINKKPFVLIGKGVVYDTGGLSLKPTPNSMDYMKSDMAGGAAVGCTLYALAKNKIPVHVVALVPATDNRLAEDAYTPGDVITMMSGLTVEVLNTDAEGRLLLGDALHYAKRYKPELVLDFATLTGAAAAAVGPYGIVWMGTADDKIKKQLSESGDTVYERLAEFPFWDEYDDLIKSDIADMKNIGGPIGGAITAGKFLQRFVDYPWMHFDIAGPSFLHSSSSYRGKGGTGVGVRLLVDYFTRMCAKN